jgi:predicted transcriptional regulator
MNRYIREQDRRKVLQAWRIVGAKEIAERAGVHYSSVYRLLKGERKVTTGAALNIIEVCAKIIESGEKDVKS